MMIVAASGEIWWENLRERVLLAELAAAIRERDRLTIYVNYLACRLGIEPHDCAHNRARLGALASTVDHHVSIVPVNDEKRPPAG